MIEDLDDTVILSPRVPDFRHVASSEQVRAPDTSSPDDDTVIVGATRPLRVPNEGLTAGTQAISHYRFTVGESDEPITLDVPAYVGRRPSAPRIAFASPPRMVKVASPLREVSATHIEIRQLGASVIITDLRSTNGSVVMLPGNVPRKLTQGESLVVSVGTLIDIGDRNVIRILPAERSAQPGTRQNSEFGVQRSARLRVQPDKEY